MNLLHKHCAYYTVIEWDNNCFVCVISPFRHVQLFASLWTIAGQTPLSMGFFRARILEWVAISYSRGSSLLSDQT